MIKDILYEQIRSYGIDFKYWVTINWRYKQLNELQVSRRHKGLRRLLRHFYKEPIRCWFFNEIHTSTASPHCGGFHTHALIEDCSPTRWKHPSQRMEGFSKSEVLKFFSAHFQGILQVMKRRNHCSLVCCDCIAILLMVSTALMCR